MTASSGGDAGPVALGRQLTVEYYGCDPRVLSDVRRMEELFLAAAHRSHATVIESHFHAFEPQGVSGVVIISESHFAVHAWPEHDYAAVDIFTCGDVIDFDAAVESLRRDLHSEQMVISSVMNRGIMNSHGVERLMPICEERQNRCSLSWKNRFDRTSMRGISIALDLYDCRRIDEASLEQAAAELAEMLGEQAAGEFRFRRTTAGDVSFGQDLVTGWFAGRWCADTGAAYVDLAETAGYFDPRTAAECALRALGAHHYRMQVTFRQ